MRSDSTHCSLSSLASCVNLGCRLTIRTGMCAVQLWTPVLGGIGMVLDLQNACLIVGASMVSSSASGPFDIIARTRRELGKLKCTKLSPRPEPLSWRVSLVCPIFQQLNLTTASCSFEEWVLKERAGRTASAPQAILPTMSAFVSMCTRLLLTTDGETPYERDGRRLLLRATLGLL